MEFSNVLSNCHLSLSYHYLNINEFSKLYAELIHSILLSSRVDDPSLFLDKKNLFHSSVLQTRFRNIDRRSEKKERTQKKKKKKKEKERNSGTRSVSRYKSIEFIIQKVLHKPVGSISPADRQTNRLVDSHAELDARHGVTISHFRAPRYDCARNGKVAEADSGDINPRRRIISASHRSQFLFGRRRVYFTGYGRRTSINLRGSRRGNVIFLAP